MVVEDAVAVPSSATIIHDRMSRLLGIVSHPVKSAPRADCDSNHRMRRDVRDFFAAKKYRETHPRKRALILFSRP